MPSQQRLRGDDAGHFRQSFAAQPFGLGGQPTALIVIQPQALIAELLAEYAIFLAEIIDHLLLQLVHPSGYRDEQEPERIENSLRSPPGAMRHCGPVKLVYSGSGPDASGPVNVCKGSAWTLP